MIKGSVSYKQNTYIYKQHWICNFPKDSLVQYIFWSPSFGHLYCTLDNFLRENINIVITMINTMTTDAPPTKKHYDIVITF